MFWNKLRHNKIKDEKSSREKPKNNKEGHNRKWIMWDLREEDLIKDYILHNGPGIDLDKLINTIGLKLKDNHRTRDSISSKITRIKEREQKTFGKIYCIKKSRKGAIVNRSNSGKSLELNKASRYRKRSKVSKFLDMLSFDSSSYEIATITGDDHIPFDDRELWKRFLEFSHYLQPNSHFYNGDLLDCEEINKFPKDHRLRISAKELEEIMINPTDGISGDLILKTKVQREVDLGYTKFLEFKEASPGTKEVTWNAGNHEYRLENFVKTQCPQFFGLHRARKPEEPSVLDWGYLLRCKELGVTYNNSGTEQSWTEWNGVKIGHFNKVTKNSGYTAKNLMDEMLCSLVQGHTHRRGSHFRTTRSTKKEGNLVFAIEGGCMCYTSAEYTKDPNWQNSWTILASDGQNIYPETITYINGKYLIGGKLVTL